VLISAQEFPNILPGRHAHGPIIIPDKVATQMETDGACALELELILVLQQTSDGFYILGDCSNVICIHRNILRDVAIMSHPYVGLCIAGLNSHVTETIGKLFMPMEA